MSSSFDPRPTVERIWREIGYRPEFPRDLLQPIMETFDLAVVHIPHLSIGAVAEWLSKRGCSPIRFAADRALSGCLLAQRGHGIAFLDGGIDPDHRRFALAHEFAHYFAHYLEPRRKALSRFGEAILPVLDGERQPTVAERLSEILRQTPLGGYENFLGRDAFNVPDDRTLAIEDEADLLALELLAPRDEVVGRCGQTPDSGDIIQHFGIPHHPATLWAQFVARQHPRQDPFILKLERAVKKNA